MTTPNQTDNDQATYKAHFIIPVVYTFTASSDAAAEREADRLANRPREICRYGSIGHPELGCDALIQADRTIFEI